MWARSDGSRLSGQHRGLTQHRDSLLEETAPELTGAVLLSRSLVSAGSSRTAMVPGAGLEPACP